nr:hypothetical protein [Tanacetum cinerariifolium]
NEKDRECNEVIDKNVIEQIKEAGKEKVVDDVEDGESDRRIAKDVLVDVAGFVYLVDFVILHIKEDNYKPLIIGTSFLTTTRAEIKCDKGLMTLKAGKFKIRFIRTLRFPTEIKERKKET